MSPSVMEVGNNAEDVQQLLTFHKELHERLKSQRAPITESVFTMEDANDLSSLWEEVDLQMQLREKLLRQAYAFYTAAATFAKKMDNASDLFQILHETDIRWNILQ